MLPNATATPPVTFEIDQPAQFASYFLETPREIAFYLNALWQRGSLLTAHLDQGQQFFLTTIVAVDEENEAIFLDPPQSRDLNTAALAARQLTFIANLDRVKIEFRLGAVQERSVDGRTTLRAASPDKLLRLQRREFFRLEPPLSHPLHCQVTLPKANGATLTHNLRVIDISGGGISLTAPTSLIDECYPDQHLQDCRLEIPGEGVILLNLRVRKAVEYSASNGLHNLRIGCEYVDLAGSRLAMIERYITRIERERKAKATGLTS